MGKKHTPMVRIYLHQMTRVLLILTGALLAPAAIAVPPAALELLAELQAQAPRAFAAPRGRQTWYREVGGRSCVSCHTDSVYTPGRHQRTGKVIEPMAPSVNAERLTQRKKIDKWFLRNCKWTYGRECTAQEKGDILLWLSEQ